MNFCDYLSEKVNLTYNYSFKYIDTRNNMKNYVNNINDLKINENLTFGINSKAIPIFQKLFKLSRLSQFIEINSKGIETGADKIAVALLILIGSINEKSFISEFTNNHVASSLVVSPRNQTILPSNP